MLNFIKSGDTIAATAPRALASGDGFLIGSLFAVAQSAAAQNAEVEARITGVIELPKETPLTLTAGDVAYWDNTAFKVNATSSNTLIGVVETTAGSSATTVRVRLNGGFYPALDASVQRSVDVTVSSAELLALNATPKTIVAAPGSGLAIVPIAALLFLDYGTAAYAGIAAGEDLAFKYTNAAGTQIFTVEATGFLDATADAIRYADAGSSLLTPTANAAVVLHMLTGEIITGDSPLKIRFFYRVVPTTL